MTTLMTFLLQHMLAGAIAGISEHIAMYPMDTIKTRMQALGHPGQRVQPPCLYDQFLIYTVLCLRKCGMVVQLRGSTVPRAIAAVIKREGIAGLYGGVGVTTWAAGLVFFSPSQNLHHPCTAYANSQAVKVKWSWHTLRGQHVLICPMNVAMDNVETCMTCLELELQQYSA